MIPVIDLVHGNIGNHISRSVTNILSNYRNNTSGKELGALMGMALGFSPESFSMLRSLNQYNVAALAYLFYREFVGDEAHPGIWGATYFRTFSQNDDLWFVDTSPSDALALAYLGSRSDNCSLMFNMIIAKYGKECNYKNFAAFITYGISEDSFNGQDLLRILGFDSGSLIKAVLDDIHANSHVSRVKNAVSYLSKHRNYASLCADVPLKIAKSLVAESQP